MIIPEDYFELKNIEKEAVCTVLMNEILELIDKQLPIEQNRFEFLDKVLESSIITNELDERYEICQVLIDIKHMIND